MNRILFIFDGFNIYHSIDENNNYHKYKWLDYYALANAFLRKSDEITSVNYLTAYQTWKQDSYRRHIDYVSALKTMGVNIILGRYKDRDRRCKIQNHTIL